MNKKHNEYCMNAMKSMLILYLELGFIPEIHKEQPTPEQVITLNDLYDRVLSSKDIDEIKDIYLSVINTMNEKQIKDFINLPIIFSFNKIIDDMLDDMV